MDGNAIHIFILAYIYGRMCTVPKILTRLEIHFLHGVGKSPYTPLKSYLAAFPLFRAIPTPLSS